MARITALPSLICILLALALSPEAGKAYELVPDPDFECTACEAWNRPQTPFRVFGNTWYVGPAGLSSLLVEAGKDKTGRPVLVLLDGGLTQSAALIDANIRVAGFDPADIRVILNSHAHFDHAGGIAALQRATGARVIVSEEAAAAFRTGQVPAYDPQAGYAPENGFPPVDKVETLPDGGRFTVGNTTFTLHWTPGHTPGSTSWSWETCDRGECATVLYADSLGPVSSPGFEFSRPLPVFNDRSTAELLAGSIGFLRRFDCGVLLFPHPLYFNMEGKLERRSSDSDLNPFLDRNACQDAANRFESALEKRLDEELAETARDSTSTR
ncbi:MAG: subclass B3 metallo-beta-lactamase [Xanthomonadales bacterium]|jgi:metallo-beta-lactamase class B|nr:subclass B3 metallo-beta-lactamase [Xanthomonadales bacterium]